MVRFLRSRAGLPILLLLALGVLFSGCTRREATADSALTSDSRSQAPADEWTLFRGDTGLTGREARAVPLDLRPQLIWSYATGGDILGGAAVTSDLVIAGSLDGSVYALDRKNGDRVWEFATDGGIEASAIVVDERVVIGNHTGYVYALSVESGSPLWSYDTGGQISGGAGVFQSADGPVVLIGNYRNEMTALAADSGMVRWTYTTDYYINGSAAVAGTMCVFGSCDALVHIVDTSDGHLVSAVDTGAYVAGSPAIAEGVAYAANYAGQIVAIDLDRQTVIWSQLPGDDTAGFFASPAIGRELLYIGSRSGTLYALDREDGKVIWSFTIGSSLDSSPVIAGKLLVLGGGDGFLYGLDAESGELQWSFDLGSAVTAPVALAGRSIAIGTVDGYLHYLELQ